MLTRRQALVVVVLGSMLLGACSGGDIAEQIIESQDGVGDVEIDEDSGEVSVETDDGDIVIGGGEIPDDFPIDVPDGGQVQAVLQQGNESSVSIAYQDDFDDIADFYRDWIASSGVEVVNEFEAATPPSITWSLSAGDQVYSVSVVDLDDTVQLTLIVGNS